MQLFEICSNTYSFWRTHRCRRMSNLFQIFAVHCPVEMLVHCSFPRQLICCQALQILKCHSWIDMQMLLTMRNVVYLFVIHNYRLNEKYLIPFPKSDDIHKHKYTIEILDIFNWQTYTIKAIRADKRVIFHPLQS